MALSETEVDSMIKIYLAGLPHDPELAEVIKKEICWDERSQQPKPETLPEDDGGPLITHRLPALSL